MQDCTLSRAQLADIWNDTQAEIAHARRALRRAVRADDRARLERRVAFYGMALATLRDELRP